MKKKSVYTYAEMQEMQDKPLERKIAKAQEIIRDDSFDDIDLVLRGKYDKENPRTEIEIEGAAP